jgi:hypothetical protein
MPSSPHRVTHPFPSNQPTWLGSTVACRSDRPHIAGFFGLLLLGEREVGAESGGDDGRVGDLTDGFVVSTWEEDEMVEKVVVSEGCRWVGKGRCEDSGVAVMFSRL